MKLEQTKLTSSILRTPDKEFENLKDYPFNPNYLDFKGIRIHYIDEGPKDSKHTILLLHGEPSWSYLYRHMIPILAEKYRVIAPDLIGFGKSDKLASTKDYSYMLHIESISYLVRQLDLQNITPFLQDWGGMIGFRVIGNFPERFTKIIAGNTGFPGESGLKGLIGGYAFRRKVKKRGVVTAEKFKARPSFINWVAYSQTVEEFPVGKTVAGGVVRQMSKEEIDAYNAPFPDETYKAGARVFPALVPTQLSQNEKIWRKVLEKWDKPFILTYSDKDPIMKGQDKPFKKRVPKEVQQEFVITEAGHFLQEDAHEHLCKIILDSM